MAPFALFLVMHLVGGTPSSMKPATTLFFAPHVLATFGLYADRDIRALAMTRPLTYVLAPVGAAAGTILLFRFIGAEALTLTLVAFLIWQVHHFTKQNLGVFAFWCRARGLPSVTASERSLILCSTASGALGIMRVANLAPAFDLYLRIGGLTVIAASLVIALRTATGPRAMALAATTLFYAPVHVFSVDLFTAALVYEAAHGAQYYLMVGHTIRSKRVVLWSTIAGVILVGVATRPILDGASWSSQPWILSAAKGVVAAHFVADARLWRLRDAGIRTIMKRRFSFL